MNKLWEKMKDETNFGLTENGAVTLKSTKSRVLDLFSQGGALRNRPKEEVKTMISQALAENMELGTRCLFYLRDIRGGQGERDVFREGLKILQDYYRNDITKIALLISQYGRWDDLFVLDEEVYMPIIKMQLESDLKSENPSLLGKWLPSENASSKKTKALARRIIQSLVINTKEYRISLTKLRARIGILEKTMSQNEWKSIDYSKIPSRAGMIYRSAFFKHDELRYKKFLDSVSKGEKKINASTLFPYEIVSKARYENNQTLDVMWKNLPNYVNKGENGIVVADVSGSMRGTPMDVSVSLAMYFAERNTHGIFANKFITFSRNPTLQEVTGNTLQQKIRNLERAEWSMNTDLQATFDLVLNTAVSNGVSEDDMPKNIYIVSDMEFDNATTMNGYYTNKKNNTNFAVIKRKYEQAGYRMPQLIFWNVNSRNKNTPVSENEHGVVLVSGCSPSIFKQVMGDKTTPYDFMMKVLNSERYSNITF